MVNGFAHIALYTDRFEETIAFYINAFGAVSLGRFMTDKRGCWLKIGSDILEIFESGHMGDGAFKHIAIACDDADLLFEKAISCGAAPHVMPKDIHLELTEPVSARIAFVRGINGEQIELFEQR